MDKQNVIGQLELDINALLRQVDEFKKHPEDITAVEWELFVQRLHLMHEYCSKLNIESQPDKKQEQQREQITVPVPHENAPPKVKIPGIVANETSVEQQFEQTRDQQEEIVAHISAPAMEIKKNIQTDIRPAGQKSKKQTTSVGGLFGDTLSHADTFKDEPSVADTIAKSKSEKSVADKMQHNPIKDLKDAIGINEKFLFINELFDGNLQDYTEALHKINSSTDLQSAQEFIRAELAIRYSWTDDNDHVKNFTDLVERRFIS